MTARYPNLLHLMAAVLMFILALGSLPLPAGAEPVSRHVVLVDCDYLELSDINPNTLPHIYSLFKSGGIALINTNTAGGHTRSNAAATIGAGRVAMGTPKETQVFGEQDSSFISRPLELFQARTGFSTRKGNLVVLDLPVILRNNEMGFNKAVPGTLGTSLHQRGLKTAALGNSDLAGLPQRSMAVIAMDEHGIIDAGNVSERLLTFEDKDPLGVRTDYRLLKESFLGLKDRSQFIVIDLGDLVRLEQTKPYITDRIYFSERLKILKQYDDFIGWLLNSMDLRQSRLMVASITPSPNDLELDRSLGLMGIKGEGIEPGLLLTPTTRRPGIITLYDLAPGIAAYLGSPIDKNWIGRSLELCPSRNSLPYLQALAAHIFFTAAMRPPLVKSYVILHLVVLGLIIFFLCYKPRFGRYLTPFLLALLAVPLAWLLIGQLPVTNPWLYVMAFLALVIIIVLVSSLAARDNLDAILMLCMVTALLLLVDGITGNVLQKNALLGYDPMDGARFYGIGNEYMGVLVGAVIMGSSLLIQRVRRFKQGALIAVGALYLFTLAVLAEPQWGSKFGGVITVVVAFSYAFARFNHQRINFRYILIAAMLVIIVGAGVLLHDFTRPPELRSHFGLLITAIQSRGWVAFQEIIARKLAMNYKLIKYTIWTRVYLGSLLALGILFYRPVGIFGRVLKKYPAVAAGLEGSLVAALMALIINDSGIVAAATAIIFPAATLFYLVLKESQELKTDHVGEVGCSATQ